MSKGLCFLLLVLFGIELASLLFLHGSRLNMQSALNLLVVLLRQLILCLLHLDLPFVLRVLFLLYHQVLLSPHLLFACSDSLLCLHVLELFLRFPLLELLQICISLFIHCSLILEFFDHVAFRLSIRLQLLLQSFLILLLNNDSICPLFRVFFVLLCLPFA